MTLIIGDRSQGTFT